MGYHYHKHRHILNNMDFIKLRNPNRWFGFLIKYLFSNPLDYEIDISNILLLLYNICHYYIIQIILILMQIN